MIWASSCTSSGTTSAGSRQRRGQLAHVALGALALVGQHQPGTRLVELAGDGPRDAALVGNADDEAGLALQKLGHAPPFPVTRHGRRAPVRPERGHGSTDVPACTVAPERQHRGVRRALIALVTVAVLLACASTALGHAYLVASSPAPDAKLAAAPALVTLTFNEPVQLLRSDDATVVDEDGNQVNSRTGATTGRTRGVVEIPLRPGLPDGTYTVRYQIIGADSHVIPGVYVFGVGPGELGEPYFAAGGAGPSETGPWGTSSRFLEIVGLGGLIGLLAFRWLVWAPAIGADAAACAPPSGRPCSTGAATRSGWASASSRSAR